MKTDRGNHLFDEMLGSDEIENLRQATFEAGLAGLRRRRARRRLVRICAVSCLLIFPIAIGLLYCTEFGTHNSGTISRAPSTSVAPIPTQIEGTRIITDEELFALFPGRPLALIGPPGHQQLVFLDEADSSKDYLTQ